MDSGSHYANIVNTYYRRPPGTPPLEYIIIIIVIHQQCLRLPLSASVAYLSGVVFKYCVRKLFKYELVNQYFEVVSKYLLALFSFSHILQGVSICIALYWLWSVRPSVRHTMTLSQNDAS